MGDHDHRLAELVDRLAQQPSTSRLAFESRLPVGSSAKTTAGLETSARATATRCCWPPESSAGRWVRRSSSPTVRDQPLEPLRVGLAAGDRERQDHVLLGGQDRQQVEELEDEAELVAPQPGQRAVVEAGDLDSRRAGPLPGSVCRARRGCASGSTCPNPRAHDRGEAIAVEAGADAGQRVDRGVAFAVAAGDVLAITTCRFALMCTDRTIGRGCAVGRPIPAGVALNFPRRRPGCQRALRKSTRRSTPTGIGLVDSTGE